MENQTILSADYLDIIFDGRNKLYGGYELRSHYASRAQKAMLSVLFLCFGISLILFFHREEVISLPIEVYRPINPTVFSPLIPSPKIEPTTPLRLPPASKLIANTVPKIVADNKVAPKDVITDGHPNGNVATGAGNANSDGISTDGNGVVSEGNGTEEIISEPVINKPIRFATIMPSYKGELNDFLQKNLKYPAFARENNIQGKVIVEFIVNEDGSVSNAVVKKGIGGGCDEEAIRVVNSMPHWKPGKQNDKDVKVYLMLPIFFQLQ